MKRTKKLFIALLCALTVTAGTVGFAACDTGTESSALGSESEQNSVSEEVSASTNASEEGEKTAFSWKISVQNATGTGLKDAVVSLMDGERVVASKKTTAAGNASFTEADLDFGNYTVAITPPAGYVLEGAETVTLGDETEAKCVVVVTPTGVLPASDKPEEKQYELGDVMYDVTLRFSDGSERALSDIVKEKKMVLLNFWATWCDPCKGEFPYMNEAYLSYAEDVAVITLTIEERDTQNVLANFKETNGYSFDFAGYDMSLIAEFGISRVPKTVIIDRYGVVAYVHEGALDEASDFTEIFDIFTHENYKPVAIYDLEEAPDFDLDVPDDEDSTGGNDSTEDSGDNSADDSTEDSGSGEDSSEDSTGGDDNSGDDNDGDDGDDDNTGDAEASYTLEYTDNGNGYTVSGKGDFAGATLSIPSTYNGQAVTAIGEMAFMGCTSLTTLIIPDSVSSISMGAFSGCYNLMRIEVGAGLTNAMGAFDGCNKVTEICDGTMSSMFLTGDLSMYSLSTEGVRNIYMPGMGSSGLTTDENGFVTYQAQPNMMAPEMPADTTKYLVNYLGTEAVVNLPEGINVAGRYAFSGNSAVQTINVSSTVNNLESNAFASPNVQTVNLPASVTFMSSEAFEGCSNLAAVNVDAGNPNYSSIDGNIYNKAGTTLIRYMPANAATEYTTPSQVTEIGWKAFNGARNLQKVTIGEGVTKVNTYAFYYNRSIVEVTIKGATEFGTSVFAQCAALETVNVEGAAALGKNMFRDCSHLKNVSLAEGVTFVGGDTDITETFANCKELEEIYIPGSVTRIHNSAFSGCSKLKNIVLGEGVKYICEDAFNNCKNFTLVLPKSVTWVHRYGLKASHLFTAIYYAGTQEELANIYYYLGGEIERITNNWYFFSESEPTEAGNYWHYNADGEVEVWNVA